MESEGVFTTSHQHSSSQVGSIVGGCGDSLGGLGSHAPTGEACGVVVLIVT